MRRLLACLSAVALTGTLTAPATAADEAAERGNPSPLDASLETVQRSAAPRSLVTRTGARGTTRVAAWRDPADGPVPERDLRRLAADYKPSTGVAVAKFKFDARPRRARSAFAVMFFGRIKNGACHARMLIGGKSDRGGAAWATSDRSGNGSASRSGRTVKFRVKAGPLRRHGWDCVWAQLKSNSSDTVYDQTGYVRLRKPPRAKLRMSTPGTRTQTSTAVGHWKRVKIAVENDGQADARAKGVRVRISEPKGVQVKPRTLKFKPIKPYDERTKRVRIKLKRRDTKTVKLRLTANNAGSRKGRLVIHPKPKPLPKKLVGRYFWGFKSHISHAWDNYAIAFVSKKHAYVGFPKRGVPKNCRPSTKHCVRYRYNKSTGRLKVGRKKGRYRNGKLHLGGIDTYTPTKLPKPGKRWRVSLRHDGFAMCPGAACTSWTAWLELRRNGTFEVSGRMIGRFGAKGEPGIPSGKGHYRIRRRGHLVLNYKNRKTVHTTIAILTDGKRRPDVYGEGLLINGTNFYP